MQVESYKAMFPSVRLVSKEVITRISKKGAITRRDGRMAGENNGNYKPELHRIEEKRCACGCGGIFCVDGKSC